MPSRVRGNNNEGRQAGNTSKTKNALNQADSCIHHWEKDAHIRDGMKHYQAFRDKDSRSDGDEIMEDQQEDDEGAGSNEGTVQEIPQIQKRGGGANQSGPKKKQKTNDRQDGPQGAAGDKTRVPKKGQTVQWKTIQGFVEGEAVEVVYEEKTVEGKSAKGSKEDPRVVLKSSSTGKIAVHKPEAVYFD
ncbi:hypothetical protein BDV96DRAFT_590696 [Lophiotrema nucula]|uniref:Hypervirulence associated protein TUDOR domain-containing protein n=1 Tax=Lophiotrema nucula TaxID=690887 RepID=A0A6A5YI84_9PLEO|nr:hypothetical protein BDV96DRAFT_590696 [Lophiotrema nucula]